MFDKSFLRRPQDFDTLSIKSLIEDSKHIHMTGETLDRIFYSDGRVEEIAGHNLVVSSFANLIMCLLKRQSGYLGIQYWAVGTGLSSWDTSLPNPSLSDTKLTSELGRVSIDPSEIKFLTSDFIETSSPTNIIQISHVFGSQDCNGTWREFGIFGGNATSALNSGIMINKRNHSVITKTSDMSIERTLRFTLGIS